MKPESNDRRNSMNENTNNEINIKFFPEITTKATKLEKERKITCEASVTATGFKEELSDFFEWLITYSVSRCARNLDKPSYKIELASPLNEDIRPIIEAHCEDIIQCDIKELTLRFESENPEAQFVLEDLDRKLQKAPYVRNYMKRRFYNIQKGCRALSRSIDFNREDDVQTIMEIIKTPARWYEFRFWQSPHDRI